METSKRVLLVGASAKPERYANMAFKRLLSKGHHVVPYNPGLDLIDGTPVVKSWDLIPRPIDTVSLYVGPQHLDPLIGPIIELGPRRIIANPGTENARLREQAAAAGIEYLEACTLVMLSTGQF